MAEGKVAHDLKDQAERHRRQAESVVTDCAHSDQPRDHHGCEGQPGKLAIDALEGAEPEEADEEEADASEHPCPRNNLAEGTIDKVMALLATARDIEKRIHLEPWIARHRSIHDWA